jgi:hypothetical protein
LSTNARAKAFSPSVWSAKALLNRRTNATTTQIITGHCYLNSHQFRFGFSLSASCQCGAPVESIHHSIVHCPTYSSLRLSLVSAVSSSGHPWPPNFEIFSQ